LRRATQTIISQVAALKAMVDDFGDYARLPAPAPGRLDLNALVSEVLALYEGSGVPVAKRLAENLPPVWADGAQIRQVIHNLVQNAQDALENTRAGASSPAIEVRTELDGEGVRLAVSDNGGGFPEELMALCHDQASRYRAGARDREEDHRRAPRQRRNREPAQPRCVGERAAAPGEGGVAHGADPGRR
jgi:nitrogen fixation/metabolism regulation signal transduction histidine kinase